MCDQFNYIGIFLYLIAVLLKFSTPFWSFSIFCNLYYLTNIIRKYYDPDGLGKMLYEDGNFIHYFG